MNRLKNMYPVQFESTITQITGALTVTSTSIPIANADVLPDAPNLVTIFDKFGTARETVRYGGKAAGLLTEVTRGFSGTTAQSWPVGTDITRALTSYDHDTFLQNVLELGDAISGLEAVISALDSGNLPDLAEIANIVSDLAALKTRMSTAEADIDELLPLIAIVAALKDKVDSLELSGGAGIDLGPILADIAAIKEVLEDIFPHSHSAGHVVFADEETLQEKFDAGVLGSGDGQGPPGPPGPAGADGPAGISWHGIGVSMTESQLDSIGIRINDVIVITSQIQITVIERPSNPGDVLIRGANGLIPIGNIRGAQGSQGEPGPIGPAGADGIPGSPGEQGSDGNSLLLVYFESVEELHEKYPVGNSWTMALVEDEVEFTLRLFLWDESRSEWVSHANLVGPRGIGLNPRGELEDIHALEATNGSLGDLFIVGQTMYYWTSSGVWVPFGFVGGPPGEQGPLGPNGADGIQGPQGEQGIPGQDGQNGVDGVQGPQGVPGPPGQDGAPGADGAGIQLAGEVESYAELLIISDSLGTEDAGRGWLNRYDGLLYIWSGTGFPAEGSGTQFRGPVGPQGAQGIPGIQGAPGHDGRDGVDGVQGPPGPPGPQGAQGDAGPQGLQGERGLPGADGQNGAPGPQGERGEKGDVGEQGPIGATGSQGNPGPAGPQGAQGATGPQGPPGDLPFRDFSLQVNAWIDSHRYAEFPWEAHVTTVSGWPDEAFVSVNFDLPSLMIAIKAGIPAAGDITEWASSESGVTIYAQRIPEGTLTGQYFALKR